MCAKYFEFNIMLSARRARVILKKKKDIYFFFNKIIINVKKARVFLRRVFLGHGRPAD